jgi:hypothetical protein
LSSPLKSGRFVRSGLMAEIKAIRAEHNWGDQNAPVE